MEENFREEMLCIGKNIALFRKLRNMTQAELADKLNINKNYHVNPNFKSVERGTGIAHGH